MTPKRIPTESIVSRFEAVLSRQRELSESAKDNIRSRIVSTIQSASIPDNNVTKDEQQTLKRLKNDYNIVTVPLPAKDVLLGEQGWRSVESTRLPPMCPGFNSRTRRHMLVEFVVGSLLCSEKSTLLREVFLRVLRFSPLLKNQHL